MTPRGPRSPSPSASRSPAGGRGRVSVPPPSRAARAAPARPGSDGDDVEARLALADRVLAVPAGLRAGEMAASEGPLPSRHDIRVLGEELVEVLFPESHRLGNTGGDLREAVATTIATLARRLEAAVYMGLDRRRGPGALDPRDCQKGAKAITARLLESLPEIRAQLMGDVRAAFESDPAASGTDEIVACYPGLYAIAVYRVAHRLLLDGAEVVPRMLTEHAHSRTGIDIHPGATIGESFFIDHGTGIVIGETTLIGNRVRIYQGVTLGALSVRDRGRTDKPNPKKRHPTIEDDVIIYANATILGGETVIGRGAVVGGNAWITYSVPAGIRVGVGT